MRILLLLLLFSFTAAKQQAQKPDFDRLAGKWLMQTPRMAFLEKWEKNTDMYTGAMHIIRNNDTTKAESIRLLEENGSYYYEATTANQNGGQAVKFKLVDYGPDKWVFENPAHDYPQRIVYAFVGNDSLIASISAINGPEKLTYFRFKRID